jgi:hypothetical protein
MARRQETRTHRGRKAKVRRKEGEEATRKPYVRKAERVRKRGYINEREQQEFVRAILKPRQRVHDQ